MKCGVWSVSLCLCLSVSMSVSVWEGGCSWLREVTGRRGSNFLPFSGPSVGYIEFLFWDHWETAVLGQILAGRSREVTGANFCHLAAPRPPIEFLFWDHWETAVLGQILAGRSREVTGGYGGRNGGKWRNGRKKVLGQSGNLCRGHLLVPQTVCRWEVDDIHVTLAG